MTSSLKHYIRHIPTVERITDERVHVYTVILFFKFPLVGAEEICSKIAFNQANYFFLV
jgi:hypothetical protein